MKSFIKIFILILSLVAVPEMLFAQKSSRDNNDEAIRLNPVIDSDSTDAKTQKSYPYIRRDLNKIEMNGDDWSRLRSKLAQTRNKANFTIVHVGDSHIQGDGNSGTTRSLMQKEYGDPGRGLIIPFRLAGTNEPRDYHIRSTNGFTKAVLLKQPWPTKMGFTGISLKPQSQRFSMDIGVKSPTGYFTIFSDGDLEVTGVRSAGRDIGYKSSKVDNGVFVELDEDLMDISLSLKGNNVNIYGFDMRNDNNGILYHAIGNNGAAYASYNRVPVFAEGIAALEPDLVIISLGTNEAFGRLVDEAFTAQIKTMVDRIHKASPNAKILLVTPSECQRSVRGAKGKTYQVNTNVARARDLIIDFGKNNNIPVYDFYAVAGGEGASAKWVADKLLSGDRIHRSWEGYRLDGTLMFEALQQALAPSGKRKK